MVRAWERALARWVDAGLIEPGLEVRIRAFQEQHAADGVGVQPIVRMAVAFGGVLIGAGVLLFVSANWDAMSPGSRFGLVLLLVAGFHLAAVGVQDRFPILSRVLHTVGTVSLGAGIFLAGQIFNLDEHWPGGVMLWALGSVLAFGLLRDPAHAALTAILVPAWIVSEGVEAGDGLAVANAVGVFLLALAYLTVPVRGPESAWRAVRTLGVIALLPAALDLAESVRWLNSSGVSLRLLVAAWTIALAVPFAVAAWSAPERSWRWAAAAAWTLLFVGLVRFRAPAASAYHANLGFEPYLWAGGGCCGLALWGVADRRPERVNLAVLGFAVTVLFFYFDSVMDKIGRSASLLGLGILFLAGGYALERVRRRMMARVKEAKA
jgi:uncharacterized membrane protein